MNNEMPSNREEWDSRRLRQVLEQIGDAFVVVDREFNFIYANPVAIRLAGLDPRTIAGRNHWDLLPQLKDTVVWTEYHRAFETGEPVRFEYFSVRRNRWLEIRAFPTAEDLTIYMSDVSGRKALEAELARQQEGLWQDQERLRSALAVAETGVWQIDPASMTGAWSPECHSLYGLDADAEIASVEALLERVFPEDRSRFLQSVAASAKFGTPFRVEHRVKHPVLGERWLVSAGGLPPDRPRCLSGIVYDITDAKRRIRALQATIRGGQALASEIEAEKVVQSLTDQSTEAVGAEVGAFFYHSLGQPADSFGLFVVSGAAREAFGSMPTVRTTPLFHATFTGQGTVRSDDVTADPRYGGIPQEHMPIRSYLAVPVRSFRGEILGGLLFGHREPGRFTLEHEHTVESLAAQAAVSYENALLYRSLRETNEDLEERVRQRTDELARVNADLTAARDVALAASKAKSQFLANVSHEIRTPMNGVIGITSLLLARPLDPEVREMVGTIQTSGEALLRVINDVLDLSKIEAGRVEVEPAPVEIGDLASEVAALYQGQATAKGVVVRVQPPARPGPRVLADSMRLRQVLSNFVGNAVKFTHRGEVVLHWDWSPREDGRIDVSISVADTGIGIPKDRFEAVFESFTQGDGSTQRQYGGTGLGLTIAKRLIELMGGRVSVQSQVGQGTTFRIDLPLDEAPPESGAESAATAAGDPNGSAEKAPALRVLLAEDNTVNVMVARGLLERHGCTVDVAEDGLQAISMAMGSHYDLILMDVQMPRCDGLEATRAIRESESRANGLHRPIYALTANAMTSDREACLAVGMDGFMTKPVTSAKMEALLEEVVRNASGGWL